MQTQAEIPPIICPRLQEWPADMKKKHEEKKSKSKCRGIIKVDRKVSIFTLTFQQLLIFS